MARGAMLEEGIAVWELGLHIHPRTKGFLVIDWQSFSLRLCLHRPLLPISLVLLLLVRRSFLTAGFISGCGKKLSLLGKSTALLKSDSFDVLLCFFKVICGF